MAYYPQLECVLIDANGVRTAAASKTFDVYNITTSTAEGSLVSDANGVIESGSIGSADGDVLELTHATYPGVHRFVTRATLYDAFTRQDQYGTTYIVEDLSTAGTATRALFVAVDLDNPAAVPLVLGTGRTGETTEFGIQKGSVARDYRIYPISQKLDGSIERTDYTRQTTEYTDITIPALPGGTVTSVAMTVPTFLSVSGSPITTSGTFAVSLANQTAKTFLAGPTSGGAAAPTFRAIAMADLGTGTPSSSNFLRGDGSWQTVSTGLTVGTTAISSGTANRLLYENGSNVLSESARLQFDGTDFSLVNSTAATGGSPSQKSPYLKLNGRAYASSADHQSDVRLYMKPGLVGSDYHVGFGIDFNNGSGWQESFEYGYDPAGFGQATRLKLGNPSNSSWGGFLEVTHNGQFAFKNLTGTLSGLQPGYISWTGASNLGYQVIRPHSFGLYGIVLQSQFGIPIQFKNHESGFGPSYDVYIEPKTIIGASTAPTAQLQVRATTEQMRLDYDASNYYSVTVGSSGGVTFDAVGSGAKFTFSDSIEVADAKDIVVGTSTGTKIGTSTSQKLGFFNATPVTQRSNIGAITDSTSGTAGASVDDVGGSFDQSTLNDNFATVVQRLNRTEQVLQDLGLTA